MATDRAPKFNELQMKLVNVNVIRKYGSDCLW